jgi:hypothetical protein
VSDTGADTQANKQSILARLFSTRKRINQSLLKENKLGFYGNNNLSYLINNTY